MCVMLAHVCQLLFSFKLSKFVFSNIYIYFILALLQLPKTLALVLITTQIMM